MYLEEVLCSEKIKKEKGEEKHGLLRKVRNVFSNVSKNFNLASVRVNELVNEFVLIYTF